MGTTADARVALLARPIDDTAEFALNAKVRRGGETMTVTAVLPL